MEKKDTPPSENLYKFFCYFFSIKWKHIVDFAADHNTLSPDLTLSLFQSFILKQK